jgi:hypothetical protein
MKEQQTEEKIVCRHPERLENALSTSQGVDKWQLRVYSVHDGSVLARAP